MGFHIMFNGNVFCLHSFFLLQNEVVNGHVRQHNAYRTQNISNSVREQCPNMCVSCRYSSSGTVNGPLILTCNKKKRRKASCGSRRRARS
eukprot:g82140.t1